MELYQYILYGVIVASCIAIIVIEELRIKKGILGIIETKKSKKKGK